MDWMMDNLLNCEIARTVPPELAGERTSSSAVLGGRWQSGRMALKLKR